MTLLVFSFLARRYRPVGLREAIIKAYAFSGLVPLTLGKAIPSHLSLLYRAYILAPAASASP